MIIIVHCYRGNSTTIKVHSNKLIRNTFFYPSCDCFQLSVCFFKLNIGSNEKEIVGSLLAPFYRILFLVARPGGLCQLDIWTELALHGYFIRITETTDLEAVALVTRPIDILP